VLKEGKEGENMGSGYGEGIQAPQKLIKNAKAQVPIKIDDKMNTLALGPSAQKGAIAMASSYGVKTAQDKLWFGSMLGAITGLPEDKPISLDGEWTQRDQVKAAILRELLATNKELSPYLLQMAQQLPDPPKGEKLDIAGKLAIVVNTLAYAKVMQEKMISPENTASGKVPDYSVEILGSQSGETNIADLGVVICGISCAQFNFSQMKAGAGRFKKVAEEMRKFSAMPQKEKESYVTERMGAGAWKAIREIASKITAAYEHFVKAAVPPITNDFMSSIYSDLQNRDTIAFNQKVNQDAHKQSNDWLKDWNEKRDGFA